MMLRHNSTREARCDRRQLSRVLIIVELASEPLDFEQAISEEQHDVVQGELATMRLIHRSIEQAKSRTRRFFH